MPTINPPDDASPPLVEAVESANIHLLEQLETISGADARFSSARWWLLAVLALVVVGGTTAVVVSADAESPWVTVASGASVVAILGLAGWIQPMHAIERDVIVRRWSDLIVRGWIADVIASDTPRTATTRATAQFAVLAQAYSTMTAQTLDALAALGAPQPEGEDEAEEVEELTLTPIANQISEQGTTLAKALVIEAQGGSGDYAFSADGLPPDLAVTVSSGHITGVVDNNADLKDWVVAVTATEVLPEEEEAEPQVANAKFVWTVTSAS